MTNDDCNAVYGIVGNGVVCIDSEGGKGTCNVGVPLSSPLQHALSSMSE